MEYSFFLLFSTFFFLQTSIFFWHGTAESLLDGAYVQVRVTVYYLNFFLYITPAALLTLLRII